MIHAVFLAKRFWGPLLAVFCFLGGVIPCGAGERTTLRREFTSFADFDACYRDHAIDVRSEKGFVRLVDEDYVIHAEGNKLFGTTAESGSGRKLRFSPALMGKKVFVLDDSRAGGAEVYIFGGGGEARFNGHPVAFTEFSHHGGWSRAALAPEWLKEGPNELVMQKGFRAVRDREADPPRFSFLSRDGGKTWKAAEGGEFIVNLRLRRHPSRGVLTSPVIDLANPDNKDRVCPRVKIEKISITQDSRRPDGTEVKLEARSGTAPVTGPDWTGWRAAEKIEPARYVQWRAVLATGDPMTTPVLSGVEVNAEAEIVVSPESRGRVVLAATNPEIVRSSHPYGLQRPSAKLKTLREKYRLDQVIAPGETELEKLLLLRDWARRRWSRNNGFGGKWDALEILSAPEGEKGMCVHFATVFWQGALSLGFCARPVILNHHFVAEVWSDEFGKWVVMDVEGIYPPVGFDAYGTAHYLDEQTGEPLGVLEVHRAYHRAVEHAKDFVGGVVQVHCYDTGAGGLTPHPKRRKPEELRPYERFALPPRNNHLDRLEPWEEYHGQDHYHSNGYLWWRSRREQGRDPQYSWKSDREGDFLWSVNQVHVTLTASEQDGELEVTAETFTPNFESFLYRVNGGEWVRSDGKGPDPDSRWIKFAWPLIAGKNVLEIKTANAFGKQGKRSRVEVVTD